MKLEVGKYYKTRRGQKVYVVYISQSKRSEWSVWCDDGDGCCTKRRLDGSIHLDVGSPDDIVSEWVDPVVVEGWIAVHRDHSETRSPDGAIYQISTGVFQSEEEAMKYRVRGYWKAVKVRVVFDEPEDDNYCSIDKND